MKNNVNYQQLLDEKLCDISASGACPKLLLHVCCAPCSSYVLEYLTSYFEITVFFYNPNIAPKEEFDKRVGELKRFVKEYPLTNPVHVIVDEYHPEEFIEMAKGYEHEPERGSRCKRCYELRMRHSAEYALANGYDYFTTTLSISPHKNSNWLNEIGELLQEELEMPYLYGDFKKKNGYKRSIELSNEYQLYRQDYCGCIYSKMQREREGREGDKK